MHASFRRLATNSLRCTSSWLHVLPAISQLCRYAIGLRSGLQCLQGPVSPHSARCAVWGLVRRFRPVRRLRPNVAVFGPLRRSACPDALPSCPSRFSRAFPSQSFPLGQLQQGQHLMALRALQHAQADWFEPMPFGVRERGVSRDALRDGIVAFFAVSKTGPRAPRTRWAHFVD